MAFSFAQKVQFKHCDPAGIVFYPRYFEMMNDCVEAYFDQVLGLPFEVLLKTNGIPTAAIQTRFAAPSFHGDQLILRLSITQVGRSAAHYLMRAHAGEELRFETQGTLVWVDDQGQPAPWPDHLRAKLLDQKDTAA